MFSGILFSLQNPEIKKKKVSIRRVLIISSHHWAHSGITVYDEDDAVLP